MEKRKLLHIRLRWPDEKVPTGEPLWLLYEIDELADSVLRTVGIHEDGSIFRNSIEIEERGGGKCPSLIGDSAKKAFGDTVPEILNKAEFQRLWEQGVNKPFWFPQ